MSRHVILVVLHVYFLPSASAFALSLLAASLAFLPSASFSFSALSLSVASFAFLLRQVTGEEQGGIVGGALLPGLLPSLPRGAREAVGGVSPIRVGLRRISVAVCSPGIARSA
jgi:hypothetical protein